MLMVLSVMAEGDPSAHSFLLCNWGKMVQMVDSVMGNYESRVAFFDAGSQHSYRVSFGEGHAQVASISLARAGDKRLSVLSEMGQEGGMVIGSKNIKINKLVTKTHISLNKNIFRQ